MIVSSTRTSWANLFIAFGVLYLLLPNLLFLVTWIKPLIGFPVAALCVFGYVRLLRSLGSRDVRWHFSGKTIGAVLFLAFLWTFLSGAGGFVPQSSDYLKHNLIYHDLLDWKWPVGYGAESSEGKFLCYALGYYLVPAEFGRCFGESWVNPISFLWLGAGMFLFFLWLAAFDPNRPVSTVLIFLCSAGILFAWLFLKHDTLLHVGGLRVAGPGLDSLLRKMGIANNNYDTFTRLHYQPQHAIVGWLGAALLYELTWVRKSGPAALFVWATTLLWSPFTSAALLMIPLVSLKRMRAVAYLEWTNVICGGVLFALVASYFGAHEHLEGAGAIWSFSPDRRWLAFYPLFVATQVFPLVACVYLIDRQYQVLKGWRTLFYGMALFLVLLPLYKVGFHGDLRMQASGPPMVFIGLGVAACLGSSCFSFRRPIFLVLTVIFALGAIYPITLPLLNLVTNRENYTVEKVAREGGPRNLSEIKDERFDAPAQYLGRKESFVYRVLLRRE